MDEINNITDEKDTDTQTPTEEKEDDVCENKKDDMPEIDEIALLLSDDVSELKEDFPELSAINDITALPNPSRYAALRDLGLTPREAYLASSPLPKQDSRAHLKSSVPLSAHSPVSSMSAREWRAARELFEDMSDREIEKLYRKVTK